jgi:hypothetical protein
MAFFGDATQQFIIELYTFSTQSQHFTVRHAMAEV